MRKLIYWVHQSVDGFISGPKGEFDWPELTPELTEYSEAVHEGVDTFLYGRVVWEFMSFFWPVAESMADDEHTRRFAPIWRETPKVVISNTLEKADWNTTVIGGDIAAAITELKSRDGRDLLLNGGSKAAASLTELGLIDEYIVMTHPVVLGGGRELFPRDETRRNLALAGSHICDGRVVVTHYTPVR